MSKTKKNLEAAFSGESQARNKYDLFAKIARKEGLHYIAKVFEETALNEMQHARDEFKLFHLIGDTAQNLDEAIAGEDYETSQMYPQFAKEAEAEGDQEAARLFRQIGKVEFEHRERYKRLRQMIKDNTVYKREKSIKWRCLKCGYVHEGTEPPPKCPSCQHAFEYFEPETI